MSYPSTLGFAPVVNASSVWTTPEGRKHFLALVQRALNKNLADEAPMPKLSYGADLDEILTRACQSLDVIHSKLYEPPPSIVAAVDYATVMLSGRVRMHRRLDRMRVDRGRSLQPRGCDGVSRHTDMFYSETRAPEGAYDKYLMAQKQLRTRFE